MENKDITIANGKISHITNHKTSSSINQQLTTEINLDERYILPGLMDSHVHLILTGTPNIISYVQNTSESQMETNVTHHLSQYIQQGITTIRDMGDTNFIIASMKQKHQSSSPTIMNSGNMLTAHQGHVKTIGKPIDEATVEHIIHEQVHHQSDFIKLIISGGLLTTDSHPLNTELPLDIIVKTVQIAATMDRPVAAHVYSDKDIQNAIAAGIKSLEHGIFASESTLQKAAHKNIIFTPTIKAVHDLINHHQHLPEHIVEKASLIKDALPEFINNAINYHVKIAMGTDAGTPFNYHGDNLQELNYLNKYGLSTSDCINAATTIAAELLGKETFCGKISPQYQADLIVFEKNPLDHISAVLDNPFMVIKNGSIAYMRTT
jgi:imidazolonepropionase-like amidohydrolase